MDGLLIDLMAAASLGAIGLALRLVLHLTGQPGGIDTWYFRASADALRATWRLPIHLPRYLLHEGPESYPPGFIVFLALLPSAWRRRGFWLVSPLLDTVHLLVLYAVARHLTGSRGIALVAGLVYAVTPQLIAETRNLNPRAFGALLHTTAMLLLLAATAPGRGFGVAMAWSVAAVVVTAIVFLTHASSTATLGLATAGLAVITFDWRYAAVPLAGAVLALALAPRVARRTFGNYRHAVRFWRRNLRYRGADEVAHSPIYGAVGTATSAGRWHRGLLAPAVRLMGENPFALPLVIVVAGQPSEHWTAGMLTWSVSVWLWAAAVTVIQPLRTLGPGFLYLKTIAFPTAFVAATATAAVPLVATATVAAALASATSLAVFFRHVWTRRTQHTASTPPDLAEIVAELARLPGDGVLCLPTMYSDYVAYHSGKSVLWGGHSGDLTRFESLSPVIRRPLDGLLVEHGIAWVILDLVFTDVDRVGLGAMLTLATRRGQFALYRVELGNELHVPS